LINIKKFDELLFLLNIKNEEELIYNIFYIFGEKNFKAINTNELKDEYYRFKNLAINLKEFLSVIIFYRMENQNNKLNCNIKLFFLTLFYIKFT
jgi:hypothetical protein